MAIEKQTYGLTFIMVGWHLLVMGKQLGLLSLVKKGSGKGMLNQEKSVLKENSNLNPLSRMVW